MRPLPPGVPRDWSGYERIGLKFYERGSADFSDYLLGLLNHRAGASPTITFDRKAAKESFFELLG